jgi:signal transduction histidine kinase/ActR/RegA family two-component response regulator
VEVEQERLAAVIRQSSHMVPVCAVFSMVVCSVAWYEGQRALSVGLAIAAAAVFVLRVRLSAWAKRNRAGGADPADSRHLRRAARLSTLLTSTLVAVSVVGLWDSTGHHELLLLMLVLHLALEGSPALLLSPGILLQAGPFVAALSVLVLRGSLDALTAAIVGVGCLWSMRRAGVMQRQVLEDSLMRERVAQRHGAELERQILRADEAIQAKSRFLATISHEIRTPMNGVLGALDIVERSSPAPEMREWIQIALRSGRALLSLLDDVLDYSRLEAQALTPRSAPFDLYALCNGAVALFRAEVLRKGLSLRLEIAAEAPIPVRGDGHRLRQILLNLLGNAVKFTATGQVVLRVGAHGTTDDPSSQPGRIQLRFEVDDTGPGIAAESLSSVFEPFYQAHQSDDRLYGGSGLGLAICKRLVETMGGKIWASSELGRGTRFVVEMPFDSASPLEVESRLRGALTRAVDDVENDGPMVTRLKGLRVLVVEDNDVNRIIAVEVLRSAGADVDQAVDGLQALERVQSAPPDLVLMDMQMPRMDGLAATRAIRTWEMLQPRPRMPIIALTANAMAGDEGRCLAAGMNDHLSKPFDQEQLIQKVSRWARAPRIH